MKLFVVTVAVLTLSSHSAGAAGDGPVLKWGGDASGGAPYIYDGPSGELIGFEVDLAAAIAAKLGREPELVTGDWGRLPYLLDRGTIDVVLNGYEWSSEREARWTSTVPYYVYELQLLARANDSSLRSWEDLRPRGGSAKKRIGTLNASAAERFLASRGDIELLSYPDVVRQLQLVRDGQLDGTLQDVPIAAHYGREFPELREVGEPVAPGYYVMFVRKDDLRLRDALDGAILELFREGKLREIYQKYGLWNDAQAQLPRLAEHWPPEHGEGEVVVGSALGRYAGILARAALTTVLLACLAMPIAMALGIAIASGRTYGPPWVDRVLGAYVELVRGTPLLFQLYVVYYLLPSIGLKLPEYWAGVLGLAINYSAYEAENYRAGLASVPRGQMEAALALGMSKVMALRRVVLPQAWRAVLPPVTGDFISLFKDTSVCSVIAVSELSHVYNRLSNDHPLSAAEIGLLTAGLYLLMSYPLSLVARSLERRTTMIPA